MDYNNNLKVRAKLTNNIFTYIENDTTDLTNYKGIKQGVLNKQISYDAILIETERLLNREKTLFTINTIITLCLFIAIFKTT